MSALVQFTQLRWVVSALAGLTSAALIAATGTGSLPPPVSRKVDFAADLHGIFVERCYECHGEKKQEAGLRLDSREFVLKGGDHGPAFVPGKSAESILVQVLAGVHAEIAQMPRRKEKLTPEQIGLVRAWIDQGAEWPRELSTQAGQAATNHWAFRAPVRPSLPTVRNPKWIRTPVDAFVLARLEQEKLKPSPEADKITLLRRLSLDLIGDRKSVV